MNEKNVAVVRAIGAGERKLGESADAIAATAPEGFDVSKRGAVADLVFAWLGVDKDSAPKQMDANKNKTDFGRGFGSLVSAVKSRLKDDGETTTVLRVTLSGEGGGSTTIPTDHALYAELVSLIVGE